MLYRLIYYCKKNSIIFKNGIAFSENIWYNYNVVNIIYGGIAQLVRVLA